MDAWRGERLTTPRGTWLLLVLAAAAILAARVAFAFTLPGPWFLPDEVIYLDHARHIASQGQVFYRGPITGVQPVWPALLAPVSALLPESPLCAYRASVALSSAFATLIVFPAFLIARRWLPPAEAAVAGLLAAVMPGISLYGWAALTEPLFTFVLVCCAAWLLAALERERTTDFLGCAILAGLSFWIRPFGISVILAFLAATWVWGAGRKRWREPLAATVCILAILGAGLLWKWIARPGDIAITNYSGEAGVLRSRLDSFQTVAGCTDFLMIVSRDVAYMFVATYAVYLPIALVTFVRGLWALRTLTPTFKAVLMGALVLGAGMYGLTALAVMGTPELTRMYGRYVEPLVPLMVLAGAAGWRRLGHDPKIRWSLLLLVVILTALLGAVLPAGKTSFTNNAGLWSWYLIYSHTLPAAGLAVLVAWWVLFSLLHRHRLLGLTLVAGGAIVSTLLVTHHMTRYNEETEPLRRLTAQACDALQRDMPPKAEAALWVDPSFFAQSEAAAQTMHQMASWLEFGVPRLDVRIAHQEEVANVGDYLLTRTGPEDMPLIWKSGALGIYRIERRRSRTAPSGDPSGATGLRPASGTPP